ncbi:MAG: hypothetical protein L6R40_007835 [Gallowayella cf. fulva]|nr:MAG: hypothetical protein L6R40_007835 [Xanthomendoza cf. fulva]
MSNEDASTVAGVILIVLGIITVASRFYSRWFTKAGFGWDDWTILIAMLTGIVPGALTIWGTFFYIVSPFPNPSSRIRFSSSVSETGPAAASNINPDYVFTPADVLYTKITYSTTVLYFFIASTIKISLLLLLHRIFAISRSFRIQIYTVEAAVVAFWISATVADLLDCVPLEWNWRNGNADPRYCISYNTFWLATGIAESVIDLVILALPFAMVSKLHLDRSKKFGVVGIFLLGGFVLFSGVAKVVLSYLPNSREPDFAKAALWTTVHLYTGIVCANLPPSRPLFLRIARVSTGSWVRLSSLGKRWYSLDSGQPSTDREPMRRSTPGDRSWDYNRPADVEVGRVNYEFAMYGRDGQISNANAKSVEHSPGI